MLHFSNQQQRCRILSEVWTFLLHLHVSLSTSISSPHERESRVRSSVWLDRVLGAVNRRTVQSKTCLSKYLPMCHRGKTDSSRLFSWIANYRSCLRLGRRFHDRTRRVVRNPILDPFDDETDVASNNLTIILSYKQKLCHLLFSTHFYGTTRLDISSVRQPKFFKVLTLRSHLLWLVAEPN